MRVLAPDLGFRMGFAVLGGGFAVRSGSHAIKGSAAEMGLSFRSLEDRMKLLIEEHVPDVIGVAIPYIGQLAAQKWNPKARRVTPDTIRVVYGLECKLQEIADAHGLRYIRVSEVEARKAFTGYGGGKSAEQKKRTQDACTQRGWIWCDDHAADALCIADFVHNMLNPKQAHKTAPLFLSAGLARARQKAEIG